VPLAPLQPANCGFDVGWSAHFAGRFAGHPFKSVALSFTDRQGRSFARKGEFVANGYRYRRQPGVCSLGALA
jgi:predicted flavoprotein YhiN